MGARWRLAVLVGLCTLVTACGGGEPNGDGVVSLSDENTPSSVNGKGESDESDIDRMRAYARCMREHGVDMPDPVVSGDGGVGITNEGGDKAAIDKADKECQKLLPNGGAPTKPSAEDLDRMREEAKCLREHGIDVEDPTADDPGIRIEGAGPGDEKLTKAMAECGGGKASTSVGGGR